MTYRYNIFYVPPFEDRKRISKLRADICKQVNSTEALQGPVHMSLISGGFYLEDYDSFEKELKDFCKNEKSLELKVENFTDVLPEIFWTGISVIRSNKVTEFQKSLQKIINKYTTDNEPHFYGPLHITFAYPAIVKQLKPMRSPMNLIELNRITIVRRKDRNSPYRILKHINLG